MDPIIFKQLELHYYETKQLLDFLCINEQILQMTNRENPNSLTLRLHNIKEISLSLSGTIQTVFLKSETNNAPRWDRLSPITGIHEYLSIIRLELNGP